MSIGGCDSEQNGVRGGGLEGFGWEDVQHMCGRVEGLDPIGWRHVGLKQ